MSNLINVDTQDKLRTLLTDVLPYELPLWYTNYAMYNALKKRCSLYETVSGLGNNFAGSKNNFIPLNYSISRGGVKFRELSIMHPAAQLRVCDFYDSFSELIEYYCNKSTKSLRFPAKKTTKFYGKVFGAESGYAGVEGVAEDRVTSSSYFKFKRYSFLYKFFESYDYHKLEKRFSYMMQTDIAKCFPSIYTHSIGWATKSKRLAKDKPYGSFDGEFDSLMQDINYRETNGIIIGPEVSRIFAEIILQQIDLDLIKRLDKGRNGIEKLVVGQDYDFRRYVDDYFIFYRDESVRDTVFSALEKCLIEYKLYLNDSKTSYVKRPFATEISLSKNALRTTINELYKSRYKEDKTIASLQHPDWKANKTISSIKMSLAEYDVQYNSISNYLFSSIEKKMKLFLNRTSQLDSIDIEHVNWLLVDLDVLFFIHAMDIRIRTTDRLARMINILLSLIASWSENFKDLINKKIFDMVSQAISIITSSSKGIVGLETLNLLVILTMLPSAFHLTQSKLKQYYTHIRKSSDTQDFYFSWVTFMLYIRDEIEYNEFRLELIKDAEAFISNHADNFKSTEFFLMFFDFSSCPFIDKQKRKVIVEKIKAKTGNTFNDNKINEVLKYDFVVSWKDTKYLQNILSKREFVFSYD
ncbi:antiviral reverse transcriptase Drt3b [Pseudoalteromonas sp. C12FD-1]|uniref:antiviral reverse transcriptase Drt3b n=1 Tax=Pseudoalteromonas sp. C12FD-1 TaxID=3131979 RepID=UPI00307E8B46